MNLKHSTYLRIIETVQKHEISDYRTLACALKLGIDTVMIRTQVLEERGRLVRSQNGVFIALSAVEKEHKSGVHAAPKYSNNYSDRRPVLLEERRRRHAEERAINPPKTPYRPKRPAPVLEALMEQSEVLLKEAPPDNPELGRQIREHRPPSLAAQRADKFAAGRARYEAMEREHAKRIEAKRLAKEAAKAERAKARAERQAAAAIVREAKAAEYDRQRAARRVPREMRGKFCRDCGSLGERRPLNGPCPGCGEYYEREVIQISSAGFSSLAMFDAH